MKQHVHVIFLDIQSCYHRACTTLLHIFSLYWDVLLFPQISELLYPLPNLLYGSTV